MEEIKTTGSDLTVGLKRFGIVEDITTYGIKEKTELLKVLIDLLPINGRGEMSNKAEALIENILDSITVS